MSNMKQPKRRASVPERRISDGRKAKTLLVSLVLSGTLAVGTTVAYLTANTNEVVNTFAPSSVTTAVTEEINVSQGVKESVKIENTGDTAAYIRAAVVVTWQDENGNVYGVAPAEGTDYEIDYNTDDQAAPAGKWIKGADSFWYWVNPVAAGDATGVLITSCSYEANAPEGYYLNVEILGSGIQADGEASSDEVRGSHATGASPVEIAWSSGVSDVIDGALQIKTA